MSKTNFVIINSKYREPTSKSTAEFNYSIGESLEVSTVAIKSISLVNAEYNVKEGHNVLEINTSPVTTPLVFPPGQYTVTEVMAQLVTLLNAAIGGTNTATLNTSTKKINVTTTVATNFRTNIVTSPMSQILGFGDAPNGVFPTVPGTVINAPYLPALQGSNNYHIASNTLGQGQGSLLVNNNKRPIIATIPNNVDFGELINYEVNEIQLNKRVFERPVNIQSIDIVVLDDENEVVDLQGSQVEIVLQVSIEPVGATQPVRMY